MDNAGHMSPAHADRLLHLTPSSDGAAEPGFLCDLNDSDQALADSIAEETVANMTSGQQQPPAIGALEDLAELSIDLPADEEVEIPEQLPPDAFDEDPDSSQ